MRIGSLFSGYGGLDLAVTATLGGVVAWHVEFDKHPSSILDAHYPDVPNYGDVTAVDWSAVEPVDVLTGGYPCQPFSHAGKRKGTDDERHLWPYVRDAIGALRPRIVVLENVAGHLTLGGPGVIAEIAGLGYGARWGVVRASDAGAPHRRARLFIVATPDTGSGQLPWTAAAGDGLREPAKRGRVAAADADEPGSQGRGEQTRADEGRQTAHARRQPATRRSAGVDFGPYAAAVRRWEHVIGRPAPAPTEPGRNGPRLSPRFVEWMMGLPHGWVTDVDIPRNAQLKALGNGVVPQQAALALRLILGLPADTAPAPGDLLPTPAVNDMGAGKTVEAWDAWTATMQAKHGNGNGHGKSLHIEAARIGGAS